MPNYEFIEIERDAYGSLGYSYIIFRNDFYEVEISCTEGHFSSSVNHKKGCYSYNIRAFISEDSEPFVIIEDMSLSHIRPDAVDTVIERLSIAGQSAKELKKVLDNLDKEWLVKNSYVTAEK